MYKFFLIFFLFFLFYNTSFALLNLQIKKSTDISYTNNISNVKSWDLLNIKIVNISENNNWTKLSNLNIPSWFTYSWYTISSCNWFSLQNNTNSNFSYYYSWSTCNLVLDYYPTSAINWTNTITYIYSWSIKTVDVSITSDNIITKAETRDLNWNWFLDAYYVEFSQNINDTSNLSWLLVWGNQVNSYSWNTMSWYILFSDNIYNTQEILDITSQNIVFWNINNIFSNSIIELDKSKPVLKTINWQSIFWSNTIVLSSSWNIVLKFSERLQTTNTWSFLFKKSWTNVSWIFSISEENIIFRPLTFLTSWSYEFVFNEWLRDWVWNTTTINQPINWLIVNDITPPTWSIVINNWITQTNNLYVNLFLDATDDTSVNQMMISNYSNFSWAVWENYDKNKTNRQLLSWNWEKIVYVKFKDISWNVSNVYSSSINLNITHSYINIFSLNSNYTNSTNITLSWWCNYIDSNWNWNNIKYYINETNSWIINCSWDKTWQNTFNLNSNQTNAIKLFFDWSAFENSTIKNSINIINPIPMCSSINNWTITWSYPNCEFTCNTWYTKAWNWCIANTRVFTCSWLPTNRAWNTVSSYTQTWNWTIRTPVDSNSIYSTTSSNSRCNFICQSWYSWNWSSCQVIINQSSWGWWWGGGWWIYLPTKPVLPIVKPIVNTWSSIILVEKSIISKEIMNYINSYTKDKIINLDNITSYIEWNVVNKTKLQPIISKLKKDITIKDIDYYTSFDKTLKNNYYTLLQNYSDFIITTDKLLQTKDDSLKNKILSYNKNILDISSKIKNPENIYIIKDNSKNITIYKTTQENIKSSLDKIENIIISKFDTLKKSNFIDNQTYSLAISWYNDFVLHLTIYKKYKISQAKTKALEAIKIFSPIYSKKVITKKTVVISNEKKDNVETKNISKVKDFYSLTKDLKLWSYNEDVKSLQEILKYFWYFDYNATSYLWPNTLESIKKFSKEKLNYNFTWAVNKTLREKILNLDFNK